MDKRSANAEGSGACDPERTACGGEPPSKHPTRALSPGSTPSCLASRSGTRSAARTTTTQFDTAGRVTSVHITSTGDGATALAATTTTYDPANGLPATTTQTGGATITREFDLLGRVAVYTDADGGTTTKEFDRYGKARKDSDPTGYTTYTYDRSLEPRGLLTSITDSVAGTFNATYSPDGQLVTLRYPGGVTRTDTLDANLKPVTRTYTRDSDGTVIYSESTVANSSGQVVNHTYTGGSKLYGYDRIGRLVSTKQTSGSTSGCVTRTYSYDNRTNRTARNMFNPNADGSCKNTTGTPDTQETHNYDTADRLTDTGYIYDAFGRITSMPSGLTNGFYANELVATQTLGDIKQDWTLDPANRFRAFTAAENQNGTWVTQITKLNHYGDDSDEPRWIVEDNAGNLTRMVSGPDGDLVATTAAAGAVLLQLSNLHGDIAATIDTALTTPAINEFDEFGNPLAGQPAQRYGWLGGKQRSGEALGGVILMGVRLYSISLGRFLSTDPQPGGSCNDYDYVCADPVNAFDLDGRKCWSWLQSACNKAAAVANNVANAASAVGSAASRVGRAALDLGKRALDNPIVQGVIVSVAVGLICVGTTGVGCAVLAGVAVGAAVGGANWYVNHRRENAWKHVGLGALSGAFSGLRAFGAAKYAQKYYGYVPKHSRYIANGVKRHRAVGAYTAARRKFSASTTWAAKTIYRTCSA